MKVSRRSIVLGLAAWLLVAACGSSGSPSAVTDPAAQATRPVTVTGTALPAEPSSGTDTAIGMTPPTLKGFNFTGTSVTITPGTGGPMLMIFAAHWCPHCQRELPVLVKWIEAGTPPKDLQIFLVSTGVAKARGNWPPYTWLAKENWTKPVLADSDKSEAATAWGLTAFPYYVLVGQDGKVKARSTGEMSIDKLNQMISQGLGG